MGTPISHPIEECYNTYRTIVEWGTTDGDRWVAGGLWTGRLHVALSAVGAVDVHGGSRRVGRRKTGPRVRGVRRGWWSESGGLVVVHHWKGRIRRRGKSMFS